MRLGRRLGFSVDVSFWLMALMLAWSGSAGEDGPLRAAAFGIWLAVIALALAFHEGGHALAALGAGARVHVRFHGMGGETRHEAQPPLSAGRRMLVTACGPLAGFLLAGAALALKWALLRSGALRSLPHLWAALSLYALAVLVQLCLLWNCFNLLPILPMDGGALLAAALQRRWGLPGLKAAYGVGIAVGAAVALYLLHAGQTINAAICAFFAVGSLTRLRDAQARSPQDDDPALQARLQDLHARFAAGDADAAVVRGLVSLRRDSKTGLIHAAATERLGCLLAQRGRAKAAYALLAPLRGGLSPYGLKRLQDAALRLGRWEDAIGLGREIFPGARDPFVALVTAAAYAESGDEAQALSWLRAALRMKLPHARRVLADPAYEKLRALPEYPEIASGLAA